MVMTGGGPANATQIWSLAIYRTAFGEFNLGGASALSVLLFMGALLLFAVYGLANKRAQVVQVAHR
jgi:multiple sugar transport system permease protein